MAKQRPQGFTPQGQGPGGWVQDPSGQWHQVYAAPPKQSNPWDRGRLDRAGPPVGAVRPRWPGGGHRGPGCGVHVDHDHDAARGDDDALTP